MADARRNAIVIATLIVACVVGVMVVLLTESIDEPYVSPISQDESQERTTGVAPSISNHTGSRSDKTSARPKPQSCHVLGRIWATAGRVEQFTVELKDRDNRVVARATNANDDDGGEFALGPIVSGSYSLECQANGHYPWRIELLLSPGESRYVHVRLGSFQRVIVHLIDEDGKAARKNLESFPLVESDLCVVASKIPMDGPTLRGRGSVEEGLFAHWEYKNELPPSAWGELVIRKKQDSPVILSVILGPFIVAQTSVPPEATETVLTISTTRILQVCGTVIVKFTKDGKPTDVAARLARADRTYRVGTNTRDGRAEIERVPPGWWILRAGKKGIAEVEKGFFLEPGTTVDLGTIALKPDAALEVQVLDELSQPIKCGITIMLETHAASGLKTGYGMRTLTDDNGRIWATGLQRSRYVILIHHRGSALHKEVIDLSLGDATGTVIQLTKGSALEIIPLFLTGMRTLEVRDEQSQLVLLGSVVGSAIAESTTFRLDHGKYAITIIGGTVEVSTNVTLDHRGVSIPAN